MFLPRQIKPSITRFRKSCSSLGLPPQNKLSQNKKTTCNVYNLNNKHFGRQLRSFTQQSENHLVTRKDSNEMTRELLQKLRVLKSSKQVHEQLSPIIDKFMDTLVKHKNYVSSLPPLDPNEIFANVEISLEKIEVFGFDYDYTLASYTVKVQEFIYEHALQWMIKELGYPESLLQCKYDPTFAVRGLHYDTQKGNLIKLDYLGNIQLDAAFYGRQPLSIEQLSQQYPTLSVQKIYQEFLRPLSDLYCLPEACLISDIIQHFLDNNVHFDAAYIFEDVMKAKDYVHAGNIHRDIMNNLPSYLSKQPGLGLFLQRLKKEGKKIFLLTNSNYPFVNKGMEYILSDIPIRHWTDLFDVVMVSSRKPQWFNKNRPFRVFDTRTNKIKWERVNKFSEGEIYAEGSLESFSAITGWKGSKVIYFGDHIFNDLREPSIIQGWKTGVIIKELENEVRIQSSPEYKALLGELIEVDQLFARCQMHVTQQDPVLRTLKDHRDVVRRELKEIFNSTFGSMFRTHRNATMFAHGLQRYADIYTSNVENFLQKPMHYVFYPDRIYLPHELPIPSSKLFADHSKVIVPMEVDTLD